MKYKKKKHNYKIYYFRSAQGLDVALKELNKFNIISIVNEAFGYSTVLYPERIKGYIVYDANS